MDNPEDPKNPRVGEALEREVAERQLEVAQALLSTISVNKSRMTKLLREALGPQARFWERDGRVQCGIQRGKVRVIVGEGTDYVGALANAASVARAMSGK